MLVIWGLTIWLFVEAIYRVITPEDIDANIMLITALTGFVFNAIQFKILHNPRYKSVGGHACNHDHGDGEGHAHDHAEHDHAHAHAHVDHKKTHDTQEALNTQN